MDNNFIGQKLQLNINKMDIGIAQGCSVTRLVEI